MLSSMELPAEAYASLVAQALAEDLGPGDATSEALIDAASVASARMNVRMPLVLAGLPIAIHVFRTVDPSLLVEARRKDGEKVEAGECLLRVRGAATSILSAERTALNFVQHLSGIATLTQRFVAACAGSRARILDTRKTLPGWRRLQKYAVACGGGSNHRMGLYDMILVKDNHLEALRTETGQPIALAVRRAREKRPELPVEVEVDTLEQLEEAVESRPEWILLDNMTPAQLREAVARVGGRCRLEASGGVSLETVGAVAATGVDAISVGALTHSAGAADIGLDFELHSSK